MWVFVAVQIILSVALLLALFVTVAWLRSHAHNEREIKLLLETLTTAYQQLRTPAAAAAPEKTRRGGSVAAPIPLDTFTDSRRTAGLTVAMELPRSLAVQVGGEVVELDADTVARIEALQGDVKAGRLDGAVLQRVIEAGFEVAGDGAPDSGEHVVASNDSAPMTPVPPTRPPGG